jgi:hypothetical protein
MEYSESILLNPSGERHEALAMKVTYVIHFLQMLQESIKASL